ncbi:hypothetical protein [Microbacterium sp. NC79]|uniref:hypothetical protein n=1 Tax=Microbacterium sp. NC79 TaxID=2851009 RepID=UPI001C2CB719|nr:hypothetical protein [Microbacterium sp. NC79]MBV0895314.1 hypothetical protein [Microbacterium sp. NC79]
MRYEDVMRAVVRVPVMCLIALALSIVGYSLRWYSLVIVMMVLVAIVLAFPAWSGAIVSRMWKCPSCGKPLPISFRFGLVLPAEVTYCPLCEHSLRAPLDAP